MLIAGNAALTKGFYLVQNTGNAAGSNLALIRTDTLAKSTTSNTQQFGGGALATDTTGIKASLSYKLHISHAMTLCANVHARIRWILSAHSGAGSAQGRTNVDIQKNAGSISTLKAQGQNRSLTAADNTQYDEHFGLFIPNTTFAAGDTLDFLIEFEVTVASGSGGTTSTLFLSVDPVTASKDSLVEIYV